jgi:GTP-binding protein YchF
MKIVLCGLPFSGKSTIFKALVGKDVQPKLTGSGKVHLSLATLEAKDERLEKLGQILNSQKITHPKITLVDLANPKDKAPQGIETAHLREFDLLAEVLGVFSTQNLLGDLSNIEQELLLADLQIVQNRIEKIKKESKGRPQKEGDPELLLLERLSKALEGEKQLKDLGLNRDEQKMLAGFQLLTLKPRIILANLSEQQLKEKKDVELEKKAKQQGLAYLLLCAKLEAEIEELPEAERAQFLKEMGLASLSRDRFVQLCFQAQNLISFFTVVGKEARAWGVPEGTTALQAAGSVHSDMERGFIRAEVINYKDFIECGSFAKAKEKGLLRLESKEYPVQDADIINFKFSV